MCAGCFHEGLGQCSSSHYYITLTMDQSDCSFPVSEVFLLVKLSISCLVDAAIFNSCGCCMSAESRQQTDVIPLLPLLQHEPKQVQ